MAVQICLALVTGLDEADLAGLSERPELALILLVAVVCAFSLVVHGLVVDVVTSIVRVLIQRAHLGAFF